MKKPPESLTGMELDLLRHLLVAAEAEQAVNPPSGLSSERALVLKVIMGVLRRAIGDECEK